MKKIIELNLYDDEVGKILNAIDVMIIKLGCGHGEEIARYSKSLREIKEHIQRELDEQIGAIDGNDN